MKLWVNASNNRNKASFGDDGTHTSAAFLLPPYSYSWSVIFPQRINFRFTHMGLRKWKHTHTNRFWGWISTNQFMWMNKQKTIYKTKHAHTYSIIDKIYGFFFWVAETIFDLQVCVCSRACVCVFKNKWKNLYVEGVCVFIHVFISVRSWFLKK